MSKSPRIAAFALALALATTGAQAANQVSYPPTWAGDWCMSKVEEGWVYYSRSKPCKNEVSLTLNRNGDYVKTAEDGRERCKAKPLLKGWIKGWIDYTCTDRRGHVEKRIQKFLMDTKTGELMQNLGDEAW
jgi:hypothetical protein